MVFQRGHRRQYTPHDTAALCGLPTSLRSRPMPPKAYFEDLEEKSFIELTLTPKVSATVATVPEEFCPATVPVSAMPVSAMPISAMPISAMPASAMPMRMERKNSYRSDSITASPSSFSLKSGFLLKSTHHGITAAVRSVV